MRKLGGNIITSKVLFSLFIFKMFDMDNICYSCLKFANNYPFQGLRREQKSEWGGGGRTGSMPKNYHRMNETFKMRIRPGLITIALFMFVYYVRRL